MSPKHTIANLGELPFVDRPNRASEYKIAAEGYRLRMLRFDAATDVLEHAHTKGPVFKILLEGEITYDNVQSLRPGQLARVDAGQRYSAHVCAGTIMVLIEPSGCDIDLGHEH